MLKRYYSISLYIYDPLLARKCSYNQDDKVVHFIFLFIAHNDSGSWQWRFRVTIFRDSGFCIKIQTVEESYPPLPGAYVMSTIIMPNLTPKYLYSIYCCDFFIDFVMCFRRRLFKVS